MNKAWPEVQLGEVLRHRKEFMTIDELTTYRRPRVQLRAQGIVLRDEVAGALIKTKQQQVCRAGELLVAEIDAKVGGFGIVPVSLDESIVSNHYFLFEIDEKKLAPRFLDYFIRTPAFGEQIQAKGSTNYAAIRPDSVLRYTLPLPSLAEQRRVVARIEELVAQVEHVRTLRRRQELEIRQMLLGTFQRLIDVAPRITMQDVAPLVRRPVGLDPNTLYGELGIRSFGNGTFHKPPLSGIEIGYKRVFHIEPGDLLFSNVFAWEGAIAVAKPEDRGRIGSHRFITRAPKLGVATAQFLCFYFLTQEGLEQIRAASPGGALRNRTLGLTALDNIKVPIPPVKDQRWFDTLQAEVAALRLGYADFATKLDALLPAVVDRAFKGSLA